MGYSVNDNRPCYWWWFSFADQSGFLGACIVDAPTFQDVHQKTHALGINPGGEVKALQGCSSDKPMEGYEVGKLYTREELEALDSEGGLVKF